MAREVSWLGVTIEAPGEDVRCSPQEGSAFGVPTQLEFSTELPGGFGAASFTLPRPDYFAVDQIRRWLMAPVRFFDEDNRTVYEGRITGNSQVGANEIQLECEGFSKSLEDREDARELIIDSSLERWGEASIQRRYNMTSSGSSYRYEAGSGETGGQDAGALGPGITFTFENYTSDTELGESFYFGAGVDLGKLRYDFNELEGGGDPAWDTRAFLSSDDLGTSTDAGTDHSAVDASNQTLAATTSGRKYAIVQSVYTAAWTGTGHNIQAFLNLKALGRHGLTEHGTWPAIGFYLSDIVPYLIAKWAPLLNLTGRSIEQTSFAIPHALWLEDTKPLEMIESLVLYGGNTLLPMDWGVYENREFFLASPGNHGRVWRTRLDEGAESTDAGDDAKQRYNGVKMTWQDASGQTHTVGPPGSSSDVETTALLDPSPTNPINFAKGVDNRFRSASIERVATVEQATLAAQLLLAESNRRRWSGDMDLKGWIREFGATEQPAYMVRAGDRGVVEDEPDTAERAITATTYSTEGRSVKVTIGQPPQRFETLMARADVVLQGVL